MALDEKVKEAIFEAVSNNNQSENVAQKVINLLEELSNGTINLNNQDDIKTYFKVILEAIKIKS
jgi:hypothetical protein